MITLPETVLARIGHVLYWLGCVIAALALAVACSFAAFATGSDKWVGGLALPFAVASWTIGWACRYVLCGFATKSHNVPTGDATEPPVGDEQDSQTSGGENQPSNAAMEANTESTPTLKQLVEMLKVDFPDDPDLVKQAMTDFNARQRQERADLNALHRQELTTAFEARKEYARHVGEQEVFREQALQDYGLQTLKWLFLLNAGAIGIILAFVGARAGRTEPLQAHLLLVQQLWPFACGCVLIPIAGAAGWFNWNYASLLLPSVEEIFNFFNLRKPLSSWPRPKGAPNSADLKKFYRAINWKLTVTRGIAVMCTVASILMFVYGVFNVVNNLGSAMVAPPPPLGGVS